MNAFPSKSLSDNRKSAIQNPKWVGIFAIALTFAFGGAVAQAQQPGKIPTIGFMRGGSPTDPEVEAFRQGLRELGYVEGKNIIIEVRNTDGKTDHFSGVAAELVRREVQPWCSPPSRRPTPSLLL